MALGVAHKARCQQPIYHDKTRRYRDKPVHLTLDETESGTSLTINCCQSFIKVCSGIPMIIFSYNYDSWR